MLLAIDVGNTNIVFGIYDENHWRHHWRIQTARNRMPDEYAVLFHNLLAEENLQIEDFDRVALCSVVPSLTRGLSDMFERRMGHPPFVLRHGVSTGLEVHTDHPEKVGSDLIADSVAAYHRYQSNCIVVDFGTATTVTAVVEPGAMVGTAIAAGLNVTIDALVSQTAQLPQIELIAPPAVTGKNTTHAMQAGLVLGHVFLVEGLVNRMKQEIGPATVIATGGLSTALAPLTTVFDEVDLDLTLEGLRLITERN